VVDGTILPNSNDINMDDVEDISVLSGPAASAILGSQGANGAIIITTKKAKLVGGRAMGVEVKPVWHPSLHSARLQNDYAGGNVSDMYKYSYRPGIDPVEWRALDGKYYLTILTTPAGDQNGRTGVYTWYSWYPGSHHRHDSQAYSAAFQRQDLRYRYDIATTLHFPSWVKLHP
jgi:TonB-dependent SusC/RagA subfamily outer membrane receptor